MPYPLSAFRERNVSTSFFPIRRDQFTTSAKAMAASLRLIDALRSIYGSCNLQFPRPESMISNARVDVNFFTETG